MACVGNPRLRTETGAVQVEAPFSMTLSPRCPGYYTLPQGEEVAQGRGRCGQCREEVAPVKHLEDNNNTWLEDPGRTSGSQTDEDMKVGLDWSHGNTRSDQLPSSEGKILVQNSKYEQYVNCVLVGLVQVQARYFS